MKLVTEILGGPQAETVKDVSKMKRSFAAQQRLRTWNRKRVGKLRAMYCARSHLPENPKKVAAGADSDGGSRQGHNASRRRSVAEERLAQVLAARRKRQEDKL